MLESDTRMVPHDDFVSELVPPYEGGQFVLAAYAELRAPRGPLRAATARRPPGCGG